MEHNEIVKVNHGGGLGPLTFGFDIGMASVGWAVLAQDQFVDMGVRCFDPGENEKGEPHNQKRRGARVARNRLHMRRWRLRQLLRLFCDVGIIARPEAQLIAAPPRAKNEPESGPWQLRAKGLNEQLTPLEWARVLYHLVKHRGFEFFRKSEVKSSPEPENNAAEDIAGQVTPAAAQEESSTDKEKQKLTKALEDSSKLLDKYRKLLDQPNLTIAAMLLWLAQDDYVKGQPRPEEKHRIQSNTFHNKGGDYRHAFRRAVLRQELQELFSAQIAHQNPFANIALPGNGQYFKQMLANYGKTGIPIGGGSRSLGQTFQEAVFDLFDMQHPPLYAEQINEMVGKCELIEGQPRASKNAFSSERATWLEKLNHLKVRRNGKEEFLTQEERQCLVNLPYEHRVVKLKLVRETLMAKTGFPASWNEASFNVVSYQSMPASDAAWILIASYGKEPRSLAKWADNKERKEKLKKAKDMLTVGVMTFQQLRKQLGLADSDRLSYKLKETRVIPRSQESSEYIPFAAKQDGLLSPGQSFRYISADGKPKTFPKPKAWGLLSSLRSHSAPTLADWRSALHSLKDMQGTWQFEHTLVAENSVAPEDEAKTEVPLQFDDAQTVEAEHKLVELKGWHAIRLALAEQSPERWANLTWAYREPISDEGKTATNSLDKIAKTLTICQTDQEIEHELTSDGYSRIEIGALQCISFNKFRNLSIEALQKILPHLETGHVYSKACELADLSHSEKTPKKRTRRLPPLETILYQRYRHGEPTKHFETRYKELRNPVVARAFNQARLVFNDLVSKYGSPTWVHVETARDMSQTNKRPTEVVLTAYATY
jgi:CRISPR/Cas system Type II protein with McrA/HNH and RuvC-like nuclease domain